MCNNKEPGSVGERIIAEKYNCTIEEAIKKINEVQERYSVNKTDAIVLLYNREEDK